MLKNTFWNGDSDLQAVADKLHALVPDTGMVEKPSKNKELERFRKASNCYYDLYNNGLGNHARSYAKLFGIAPSHYQRGGRYNYTLYLYEFTEKAMRGFVKRAAEEQGIEVPEGL